MIRKLPIYELLITDENDGMTAISFVKYPATETPMLAFSKEDDRDISKVNFSVVDEEKHRVCCVIMRANQYIYRRDEDGYEYYVYYSADTLEKMATKLLKDGNHVFTNIEHQENTFFEGADLTQIFIKDVERGINPIGFEDIEDKSLFGCYTITNDALWDAFINGEITSVSLEGFFNAKLQKEETIISSIEDLIGLLS